MPSKNPEKARQLKHEWYMRKKERVLQQKRERRAALRKLKPSRPPKPAPTPEQKAKAREANRLACNRYRATHLTQVLHLIGTITTGTASELYSNSGTVVPGIVRTSKPLSRKLRALADVCAARLLELEHGYARIEPAQEKGPREK